MNEVWKPVIGYEGRYEVSSLGRVRRVKDGSLLRFSDSHGYKRVCLYAGSRRSAKRFHVHRLVAEAFLGPPVPDAGEINHKNEDKADNRVANLEWCTRAYNVNYGARNQKVRKTVACFDIAGNLLWVFDSLVAASRATGARQGAISNACVGRCKTAGGYEWRFVT